MADFKFNFSAFGKPKVKKTCDRTRKLVDKNVLGVIGIHIDGTYYAQVGSCQLPLTIESYELRGKNVFYSIELINNKIQHIIQLNKLRQNVKKYLPFGVGCIVKGNIYNIYNTHRFNISKILELNEVPDETVFNFKTMSHEKKEFFRNNYEEIRKCMN